MTFSNSKDQAKWDNLQDKGSASIGKMLAGIATPADVQELSRLLNEQHQLAGELFDRGIADAETTADTIVDRLNRERIERGKKPLSGRAHERVFRSTFQQVLSQAIEDILGSIHDQFAEQSNKLADQVNDAFARARRFTAPRGEGAEPHRPLSESGPATPQQRQSIFERLRNRLAGNTVGPDGQPTARRSIFDRFRRRADPGGERQRTSFLQSAKEKLGSMKDKLAGIWARLRRPRSEEEEEEDKKANKWLRKLRGFFDPFKKARKTAAKAGGLLGMLAKPLLLALMNPQLIKTITDAVSKYLNFDSISNFVSSTWKTIQGYGSDIIEWIIDKVGGFFGLNKKKGPTQAEITSQFAKAAQISPKTTPDQARAAIPAVEQKVANAKLRLANSEKRYAADPSDVNRRDVEDARKVVAIFQNQLVQYKDRANQQPAGAKPAGATAVTAIQPAPVSLTPADATAKPMMPGTDSKATVTSAVPTTSSPSAILASSSASKTAVLPSMPQFKEGKAFDPVPPTPDAAAIEREKANAVVPQISLSSYGYNSGDDTLNVLNMNLIA